MIRAVVFDFDGVIANTEPLHFQALRDVLAQQAVALTEAEYYDRYLGYDDVGGFRRVFQRTMGLSPSDYRRRFCLSADALREPDELVGRPARIRTASPAAPYGGRPAA